MELELTTFVIADVDSRKLSGDLLTYIYDKIQPDYKDNCLSEDIYNMFVEEDEGSFDEARFETVKKEWTNLTSEMERLGASYLRIIY